MLAPEQFKKYGLDTDSLKSLFTKEDKSEGVKRFVNLIRDRIKDGRERSLKDYQVWAAVDYAYDAPFYQQTPTLIRHVLETCNTPEEILKSVRSWGLSVEDLFVKKKAPDGNDVYELNPPAFFETLIPVVRAYMTVRVGKIFNDRNLLPLFKYEPQKYTELNRVRCEIITDIVQAMTAQFGYAASLRQMIFQALLYSVCIKFPMEAWYTEKGEDANGKEITEREGLRYVTPHVTRMFYDLQYPLSTLNTDTGCSFAGYWSIVRYGDVDRNSIYWNRDKISYGYNWLEKTAPYANYFEQAYPCTIELPTVSTLSGEKQTDRETVANIYSTTDYDKAVFVTYLFQKIIPKDWGIGTYDKPIWLRTIVASDDTVIHAEAYAYCPPVYAGYDADMNRARNASLALEIIPFQDHFANIITQMLLTIKRNLANIVFYDTNVVDDSQVDTLRQHTNWQYQRINLIGFDSFKQRMASTDTRTAFHEVKFQYADISQMTQAFVTMMSILERLLVVSPQEIGGQATHQQSKAEVVIVAGNTTNRVSYTASFIDEAIDAWKKQLYDAILAYLDAEVAGQVSTDIPNLKARLEELGFKPEDISPGQRKVAVTGRKEKLRLEGFASTRDGPDRGNDRDSAQAVLLAIQSLNNNPRLAQVADPQSILDLIQEAAKMMGADKDFKIRTNPDAMKAQQLQEAIQQISQLVMEQVAKEYIKPAVAAVSEQEQKNVEQDQQLAAQQQTLEQITKVLQQVQQTVELAMAAPPLQPPGVIDQIQPGAPPLPPAPPAPPVMPPPQNEPPLLAAPGAPPEVVPGMVG